MWNQCFTFLCKFKVYGNSVSQSHRCVVSFASIPQLKPRPKSTSCSDPGRWSLGLAGAHGHLGVCRQLSRGAGQGLRQHFLQAGKPGRILFRAPNPLKALPQLKREWGSKLGLGPFLAPPGPPKVT